MNHSEVDSGIDLDLMSFITADEDPVVQDQNFYEIKHKIIVGRWVFPVAKGRYCAAPLFCLHLENI